MNYEMHRLKKLSYATVAENGLMVVLSLCLCLFFFFFFFSSQVEELKGIRFLVREGTFLLSFIHSSRRRRRRR